MARRYFVTPLPLAGRAKLPAEVSHHLAKVVRVRVGDSIVLFDGAGREAAAEVVAVGRREVEVEAQEAQNSSREPELRVWLAVAIPRTNRAEWLFEHATEVGVSRFCPLRTERTRPLGDDAQKRLPRWTRIVQAASGQCDRARVPTIDPLATLPELLVRDDLPAARWFASARGEPLGAGADDAILVVGPEGGLTEDEEAALEDAGFRPASLGPLTLRTETAALVGAARLLQ